MENRRTEKRDVLNYNKSFILFSDIKFKNKRNKDYLHGVVFGQRASRFIKFCRIRSFYVTISFNLNTNLQIKC